MEIKPDSFFPLFIPGWCGRWCVYANHETKKHKTVAWGKGRKRRSRLTKLIKVHLHSREFSWGKRWVCQVFFSSPVLPLWNSNKVYDVAAVQRNLANWAETKKDQIGKGMQLGVNWGGSRGVGGPPLVNEKKSIVFYGSGRLTKWFSSEFKNWPYLLNRLHFVFSLLLGLDWPKRGLLSSYLHFLLFLRGPNSLSFRRPRKTFEGRIPVHAHFSPFQCI